MVVATAAGATLVRMPTPSAPTLTIVNDEALAQAGGNVIAVQGDQLVIARPNRGVQLLTWSGDHFVRTWASSLPADSGRLMALSLEADFAVGADDLGFVYLLGRTDGVLRRRIQHGDTVLCVPFIHLGQLVVGDRSGRITAYHLPPLK